LTRDAFASWVTMGGMEQSDSAAERQEPDPRITLANERTFLAWIRTSLGMIAGGVALAEFGNKIEPAAVRVSLALAPVVGGTTLSMLAFRRWRSLDRVLREHAPLPPPNFALGLSVLVAAVGLLLSVTLVLGS
jgi:putative membrane protein